MEQNPILIVDTDIDDIDLVKQAVDYLKINRPVLFFHNGYELEDYLSHGDAAPFLIICDVKLAGEDGFELKKRISADDTLKYKSVPFIYWSTAASERQIQHAYDIPAQGFFVKPSTFDELCSQFETILAYWQQSRHPKRVQ